MKPIIFLIFFLLSTRAFACIPPGAYPPSKHYWGDNCDDPSSLCYRYKEEYDEELREYYQEQQDYKNCVNEKRLEERIRKLENQIKRENSNLNSNGIWGDL